MWSAVPPIASAFAPRERTIPPRERRKGDLAIRPQSGVDDFWSRRRCERGDRGRSMPSSGRLPGFGVVEELFSGTAFGVRGICSAGPVVFDRPAKFWNPSRIRDRRFRSWGNSQFPCLARWFLAPPSGCGEYAGAVRWSSTDRLNSGIPPGFGSIDPDRGILSAFSVLARDVLALPSGCENVPWLSAGLRPTG